MKLKKKANSELVEGCFILKTKHLQNKITRVLKLLEYKNYLSQ